MARPTRIRCTAMASVALLSLILCVSLLIAGARADMVQEDLSRGDDPVLPLLQRALRSRVSIHTNRRTGLTIPAYHCRLAKGGCDARLHEFAQYLKDSGERFELDPWLLAAMAIRESGLNPFVVGLVGERGILQLHPKNRHFKNLKFVRDGRYRARCQREIGACQREVVDNAAALLSRAIGKCGGNVEQALGMYNTGRCGGSQRYADQVYRVRRDLMRRAGLDEDGKDSNRALGNALVNATVTPKRSEAGRGGLPARAAE